MKKSLSLLMLLGLFSSVSAQSLCFDPENDNRYATGPGPRSIARGDFNNDGSPDIVVANSFDYTVSLLTGNNDGTFNDDQLFGVGTNSPSVVMQADFNSDNRPDIVTLNRSTDDISLLLNDGNGGFEAPLLFNFNTGSSFNKDMAWEDMNGDGKTDLVINDYEDAKLYIIKNNGDGTLALLSTLTTATGPQHVAVGDLNNDNDIDVAVSYVTGSGDSISYFSNDGSGGFGGRTSIFISNEPFERLIVIDNVSGNGLKEIVVQDIISLVTLVNGPALTFTPVISNPFQSYPSQIFINDVNTDGARDLVYASRDDGTVNVAFGNNNGTFQSLSVYSVNGGPEGGFLGDFDNDGTPDFIAANESQFTVSFVKGHSDGSFGPYALRAGKYPQSIVAGDINHDNHIDLIAANTQSAFVSVMTGNGDGTFDNTQNYPTVNGATDIVLADFNNNGDPDLMVFGYLANLLKGNGNGSFSDQASFDNLYGPGGEVNATAADLNNDGNMDIVVMLVNTDSLVVSLGNGNFTFDAPVRYTTGNYPNGVAVALVNTDNFPDILVANDQSNDISVFAGNGDGTFQQAVQVPAGSGPRAVATGDFDGDTKTDFVAVNNNSNNITVHLGNGNLTFDSPVPYALGNVTSALDVAVAKINSDDFEDILVVLSQSHSVALLLGNGDGTFQDPAEYTTDHSPYEVVAADFNEDNVTDFATVNYSTNNVSVVLNNSAFITASGPTQICEGDSLMVSATGGYSYLWNTGSQSASILITESGDYTCSITNQAGDCTIVPPAIPVTVNTSSVNVSFNNPTPVICNNADDFSLQGGSPQGGIYSGPFVSNGLFSPALSGAGTFTVTYTYADPGGCATGSDTANITVEICEGIGATNRSSVWKIFPNPVDDVLFVQSTQDVAEGTLRLESLQGQDVLVQKISGKETVVSLPLSPGIYLLYISADTGNQVFKIVKN